MRCNACQSQLASGARFCQSCGTRISTQTPADEKDPLQTKLESVLKNQYEIVRLLGKGGMGAVYLARDKILERLVAIKVLEPKTADVPESRQRFRREARTAAKLSHPNIVPLHSYGETEGIMYYVMGYVRGESLGDRMRRETRVAPDEVRKIVIQSADALAFAHRHGVVHRDIKPDNILIDDESGRVMLADFGIAKAPVSDGTLTGTGSIVGTPLYMSPEQAAGKGSVDGRSDIYSLGVIGYTMLSGHLPFEATDARDILIQHMTQEPQPIADVAPGTPDDLAALIMRCLKKEPDARWQNAINLRDAIAPVSEFQEELPEHIEKLDGSGCRVALMALGAGYFMLLERAWSDHLGPVGKELMRIGYYLVLLAVASFSLDFLIKMGRAHKKGVRLTEAIRVALRQPEWWRFWYPRVLRKPGDVWDRLPAVVRHFRTSLGAFVGTIFVLAVPNFILALSPDLDASLPVWMTEITRSGGWPLTAVLIVVIWFLVSAFRVTFWASKKKLESKTLERLYFESTAKGTFWKRPQIAAILEPPRPASNASKSVELSEAHAHVDAIKQASNELTGLAQQVGRDALTAARDLLSLAESLDDQNVRLRENADRAETDDTSGRRTHYLEWIKNLREELLCLRDADSEDTPEAKLVVERIQSSCAEIKAHMQDVFKEPPTLPR